MNKIYYSLFTLLILLVGVFPLKSLTTLNTGDILIISINGDADATVTPNYGRGFSFMPLVNLEAGTIINFTDYGWSDLTNSFITNTSVADQFIHYTAPTNIIAGTVIRCDVNNTTNFTFDFSYATGTGNNYLNIAGLTNGDELLVFTGSRLSPTFICAASIVNTSLVAAGWATNVPTDGTDGSGAGSALPPGLTEDVTALSFNRPAASNDNCSYSGITTPATADEWKNRIKDYANWTFNDAAPIPPPLTGPFVVLGLTSPPTVTTTAASAISTTAATIGGNVTADGGATVSERGVVYSTTDATPTIAEGATKLQIASGTGAFSQEISSLSSGTTYYYNAYAINSEGTSYGTATSFKTLDIPVVVSTTPANLAENIGLRPSISITFNTAMSPATISAQTSAGAPSGTVQISADNFNTGVPMTSVSPIFSNGNKTITYTLAADLEYNKTYKIRVTTGAVSIDNVSFAQSYTSEDGFKTLLEAPLSVVSITPTENSINVSTNPSFAITFNNPINPATITAQTVAGAASGTVQVSADNFANAIAMSSVSPSISNDNKTITYTPSVNLNPNTTYKIRVTTAASSALNNSLSSAYTSEFTTGSINNPFPFYTNTISTSQINVIWGLNNVSNTVILAYNTINAFGEPSGAYNVGDEINGGGQVLYIGVGSTFSHLNLTPAKHYYYKIWSFNGVDSYSSGATYEAWTLPAKPLPPTVTQIPGTFDAYLTISPNGNSDQAVYQIYEYAYSHYLQADGTLGATSVLQTKADWETYNNGTAIKIKGLSANTYYRFMVDAATGESDPPHSTYSNETVLVTTAIKPSVSTYVSSETNSINFSINPNENPAITDFAIYENISGKYVGLHNLSDTPYWWTKSQWEESGAVNIRNLESATQYNWQVKAKNILNVETDYSPELITKTLPSEARSVVISNQQNNSFDISWTRGNGDGVKVFIKAIENEASNPSNGVNYTANPGFSNGSQIGTSGWYCVYSGTGTGVSVSNVNTSSNIYTVHVVEYVSFTNNNYNYNTASNTSLATTLSKPTIQASNIRFSNISRTGMTVKWTRGNGDGSILLVRESNKIPASVLTDKMRCGYPEPADYNAAEEINGVKVLYFGLEANPSVAVQNLNKYKLVYFKVCEFNDYNSPIYLQTENASNPASRWTLRRDGLAEEDLTIDAEYAYPNPAKNSISTTLDMFEAGSVIVKLFDETGKESATLYDQSLPFGTHELKFDISSIPNGVYQLVISKGAESIVYPVSVVR
jgi:hypothetical protein